jgi:hypothetical protein
MMLKFEFLPSEDDEDPIAHAIVIVGESSVEDGYANWYIPIDNWSRRQYIENWLQSLNELENNGKGSFLMLAGEIGPDESVECFFAWKKGEGYIFQNGHIYQDEIDEPININESWKYVADRPCRETEDINISQEEINNLRASFIEYLGSK